MQRPNPVPDHVPDTRHHPVPDHRPDTSHRHIPSHVTETPTQSIQPRHTLHPYNNAKDVANCALAQRQGDIDACFGPAVQSVAAILAALEQATDRDWAQTTLEMVQRASPTSLYLTFRTVDAGRQGPALSTCLQALALALTLTLALALALSLGLYNEP